MARPTRADEAGRTYLNLQRAAREQRRGTQELFTFYVLERFLYRVSISRYADHFILKGGLLLAVLDARRPTRDAGFLLRSLAADEEAALARVREIAALPADDGVVYVPEHAASRRIRQDELYSGARVTMPARIATAEIKLSLDLNVGDPITPAAQRLTYPEILGGPGFPLLAYPVETVIAEKLSTAVQLGDANTRDRDYVDLYRLITTRDLAGDLLTQAVTNTVAHRGVQLRPLSAALTDLAQRRQSSYNALRREAATGGDELPELFADIVRSVAQFADPLLNGDAVGRTWRAQARVWE